MKRKILVGLSAVVLFIAGYILYEVIVVSKRSPSKTTRYTYKDLEITVVYCQPSKRGRLIFGEEMDRALQPYGKYWRLGANAPTQITFNKDVIFEGASVKAGTYRMYAVPGPHAFQVSLNSEIGLSGSSEPDYSKDIVKKDFLVNETQETEQFIINFSTDASLVYMDLIWDKVRIRVPIALPQ